MSVLHSVLVEASFVIVKSLGTFAQPSFQALVPAKIGSGGRVSRVMSADHPRAESWR